MSLSSKFLEIINEIIKEEDLDEASTTANVAGYETPRKKKMLQIVQDIK